MDWKLAYSSDAKSGRVRTSGKRWLKGEVDTNKIHKAIHWIRVAVCARCREGIDRYAVGEDYWSGKYASTFAHHIGEPNTIQILTVSSLYIFILNQFMPKSWWNLSPSLQAERKRCERPSKSRISSASAIVGGWRHRLGDPAHCCHANRKQSRLRHCRKLYRSALALNIATSTSL